MHLVVVKGPSHVLAGNTLHKYHLFIGLHDLYNLWRATRNFLFAAGPAQTNLWWVAASCRLRTFNVTFNGFLKQIFTCNGG